MSTLEAKQATELLPYDPMIFIKAADLASKMPFTSPGNYLLMIFDLPDGAVPPMCLMGVVAKVQGKMDVSDYGNIHKTFWDSPELEHMLASVRAAAGHGSIASYFDHYHGVDKPMNPEELREILLLLAGNQPLPKPPFTIKRPTTSNLL